MTAQQMVAQAACLFVPAVLLYAGMKDVFTLKIRNKLVAGFGAAFFVAAPLAGLSFVEIGLAVIAALIVFSVAYPCFALGWIGGGDAKLAPVAALWFGWGDAFAYFYWVSIFGGLLALTVLVLRRAKLPAGVAAARFVERIREAKKGVPYGLAFGLASLVVLPRSVWPALAG